MKKIFLLSLLFFSFVSSTNIFAHAVITDPGIKQTVAYSNKARQIEIAFNSKVELKLSQIFLVSAGDAKQKLNTIPTDKPGRILIELPVLESGEYAIQLRIFAADGHLSEDLIRFTVSKD